MRREGATNCVKKPKFHKEGNALDCCALCFLKITTPTAVCTGLHALPAVN